MKAMMIEEFGGPEKLHLKEIEKPVPQDNEVLIKTAYAGVNPVDWKICEGLLVDRLPNIFPIILGFDLSGTIEKVGKNVKDLKEGEEVFAYIKKHTIQWGSYAEYVTYEANHVVKKPSNLSLAEAASLGTISLTAWQSLFDAAHLKKGETVLILGASGGVGSMAVQFAKNIGARVIGTSSPTKSDYVKSLGAEKVLDYHGDWFSSLKESADVVFDCVGHDTFKAGIACLKKGGRIVSIIEKLDPNEAKALGIEAYYVFVNASGEELKAIVKLIEEGKVKPPPIEVMPLEKAAEALEKVKKGVFGKIVLKI